MHTHPEQLQHKETQTDFEHQDFLLTSVECVKSLLSLVPGIKIFLLFVPLTH